MIFSRKKDSKKDKDQEPDKEQSGQQESSSDGDKPQLPVLSEAQRKRLQKSFEHGSMQSSKGNYDYATSMFAACVSKDPGNLIYTQNYLSNLIKKYNNNKKGARAAGLTGAGKKAAVKKASMKKDWPGVITAGLDSLALNPWDTQTLTDMAKACEELELDECQIAYLRVALDASPKDLSLNRFAADAFAHTARFDEAIKCLERIAAQKPNDQEVRREISRMTVQKTIHKGGYEEAETSLDVSVEKQAQDKLAGGTIELTEEQRLRREIRRHPEEVTNYSSLKDYYFKKEDFAAAEEIMQEGVEATGAVRAREELEDVQLHRARFELLRAQKRASEKKTDEAKSLYKRMKEELNKRELEVYAKRCERYPGDFALKYELGMRLKRAGKFQEAIEQFQQSRSEARKKASSALEAGECFQQIKRYQLALNSYKEAIANSGVWDEEVKKLALYRAGWLCKGLKDYEAAEQHLSELAGMDFGYKDVAQLLEDVSSKKGQQAAETD